MALYGVFLRCSRADIGQLPLKILGQWLEAFEGDFEFVWSVEGRWVVAHAHVQYRYCRHGV